MDRGTLRALKFYMNFGYSLGFSPYQLVTIPASHQQQKKQAIRLQNRLHDVEDDEEESESENGETHGIFWRSSVIKKMREWLYKRNSDRKKRVAEVRRQNLNLDSNQEEEEEWKFVGGSRGKSGWWLLLFSMGLQATYQIFLIFKCIEEFLDKEQSTKEKIKIFYLSGILLILNFAQILLVLNYGDHDIYLNAVKNTVTYIQNLREKEIRSQSQFQGPVNSENSGRGSKPKPKSLKAPIYGAFALAIFVPLVRGSNIFWNPRSKLLITSLFSDTPEKLPIWVKLLASAFHFHVAGFSVFVSVFLGVTLLWYAVAVLPIISHSRLQIAKWRKPENGRKESKVTVEFLYRSYNMLSILQNNLKTVYGSVVLMLELVTLYVVVLNIFLTVVHGNLPSFARVIGVFYLQQKLFSSLAEIYTASECVIDSWKRNASSVSDSDGSWFKKFRESARPLRIYVGNFFYVDKRFMLTLMSITITQTVNLLLLR